MSIEFDIDGPVDLGGGSRLIATGFRGSGTATEPSDYAADATRAASTQETLNEVLADALDRAEMREEQAIDLTLVPDPGGEPSRSSRAEDVILLEAPDLGEERGQVVMLTDEDGGISFHYPVESEDTQVTQPPGTRGPGEVKLFVIPAEVAPGEPEPVATRGLVGFVGRKILQVLSFPIARTLGRTIGEPLARRWEQSNRPYGVRWFGPDDYRSSDGGRFGPDDWVRLDGKRSLLFIHGTFSTARGGFGGVPPEVVDDLWRRYEQRVFAFEHHSISADPVDNCHWLLDQVPTGVSLDLDVVSHSRGGLVARVLAGAHPGSGLDLSQVKVHSVVCAGTPNYGTPLADADHLSSMCDRFATAANLIPGLPAGEIIDTVLILVQVVAQTVLEGLSGLEVMRPGSDFLTTVNDKEGGATRYYGMAADYEPTQRGMKRVVEGLKDGAVDFVFRGADNDLVVPTEGVHTGSARFRITEDDLVSFGPERGVFHATFWKEPELATAFAKWLPGASG